MVAASGSDRYSRIENFLDKIDGVNDPSNLEEPFRSLWMRVHGDMPTLMTDEDKKMSLSSGIGTEQLSDVEITSSDGSGLDAGTKGSIEVVSPKDVGPTVEMKVEKKKITFKAAGKEDLDALKVKEQAAGKIVNIQRRTSPLKGIGGEAAKITAKVRDMAMLYRDGTYDKVVIYADTIENTITSEDFRKSVLVELQKKITEYEKLGGEMALTKERFKDLGASLKEGKEDFLNLAQATNKLAEDSIKDLVSIEEVVLAEVKEAPKKDKSEEPKTAPKKKAVRKVKEKPKLPGESEEVKEEAKPEEEEPKPVIKIIKKKVLVIRRHDDPVEETPKPVATGDEGEDFSLDLDENGEETEVPKVDKILAGKAKEDPVEKTPEPVKDEKAPNDSKKEDVDLAYKKIQFVYNASVKLHEKGQNVAQIFEIMNMAEQARQKGELKMYVGLASQLENMLISMQK
jgi:hypothetical protein